MSNSDTESESPAKEFLYQRWSRLSLTSAVYSRLSSASPALLPSITARSSLSSIYRLSSRLSTKDWRESRLALSVLFSVWSALRLGLLKKSEMLCARMVSGASMSPARIMIVGLVIVKNSFPA